MKICYINFLYEGKYKGFSFFYIILFFVYNNFINFLEILF